MKKKLFSVLILVICTLSFGFVAAADNEEAAIEAYGRDLAQIVETEGVDYSNPQPGVISQQELEVTKAFYLQQGYAEGEAEEKAREYLIKREAQYIKAIESGYTVTDDEVWVYIDELKAIINESENSEDMYALISQFENEDDYWQYEFSVYKKELPVIKYNNDMISGQISGDSNEESFLSNNMIQEGNEGQEDLNTFFENYKNQLVQEYGNRIIFSD